jgi:pyridoxamine 5'-phosphate oxidase
MTKTMPNSNFSEPFLRFESWLNEACANKNIIEPTAMCLSTVNESGAPSARMVLLKKFDSHGFCFFTNLNSRKASEIKVNSRVALCFYWGILGRQVRIEGKVEEASSQEADDYFASRRRESRIGAWASKQSQTMNNWQEFDTRIAEIENKFAGQDVSRPKFWSGFRVVPNKVEFWEEGDFRIHRRTLYSLENKAWNVELIYP